MKITILSPLLLILLISCQNTADEATALKVVAHKDELKKAEGLKFNTLIKGTGDPTIIFESGLGTPLNNWTIIQEELSASYKTISYDRKGIGETAISKSPRSIENLVMDLDSMITQSQIEGPIVLVGHSLGAHIVRRYQDLYPAMVVGLFLVDPTNEYLYDEVFKQMPPEAADSMKTAWDNSFKKQAPGVYLEWKEAYSTDEKMRSYPLPTEIPITILASYQENNFLNPRNIQIKRKLLSDWQKAKTNIKILETTNSGHYIHLGEPQWVISELQKFLEDLELAD